MAQSVLLVDRDDIERKEVSGGIGRLGYRVLETGSCGRAFSAARDRHPEAVIVNMTVDGEDAGALCQKLKEFPETRDIPVLAIAPPLKMSQAEKLLDMGADAYVSAPFRLEALLRKIERMIEGGAKEDAGFGELPEELSAAVRRIESSARRLGDMAEVFNGAYARSATFRRMANPGPLEWRSVHTESTLRRFLVRPPEMYMRFDRIGLTRVPEQEEYRQDKKLLVARSGPPVVAAVDVSGIPAGPGLYSIVPAKGLDCGYLAAIFNSRFADFYFNRVSTIAKSKRSYMSREHLEAFPVMLVPRDIQDYFTRIAAKAGALRALGAKSRASLIALESELNRAVFEVYGFTREDILLLRGLHF